MIIAPIIVFFVLLIAAYFVAIHRQYRDAYDWAVDWLTEHPEQIRDSWNAGASQPGDPMTLHYPAYFLFACVGAERNDISMGCLTMLKATNPSNSQLLHPFYDRIKKDWRIPRSGVIIPIKSLPRFAYWQRKIDKLYNRTPPTWTHPQRTAS